MKKNLKINDTYFYSTLQGESNGVWNLASCINQRAAIGLQDEGLETEDISVPFRAQQIFFGVEPWNTVF